MPRPLRLLGMLAVAAAAVQCAGPRAPGPAWETGDRLRVEIVVGAAGMARRDLGVEVRLDDRELARRAARLTPRVVEVDAAGGVVDPAVTFQLDPPTGAEPPMLIFLLAGDTPSDAHRRFFLVFGDSPAAERPPPPVRVRVTEVDDYQGQPTWRIDTTRGSWLFHRLGAGFAALVDREGHDWIGYRPEGGSAGHYRGIPNLVYPEGWFHPGGTDCESRLVAAGPLRARIDSSCEDGAWETTWDIDDDAARLTVRRAPKPFWFLYEGTPGGALDPDEDFLALSNGLRLSAAESRDDDIPAPEWLYFADPDLRRSLLLVHHEDDRAPDAYWPMEGNMTVFGFGRRGLKSFIDRVPSQFTVVLVEATEPATVGAVADALLRPPAPRIGELEAPP